MYRRGFNDFYSKDQRITVGQVAMKVHLFDIESAVLASQLEEAQELLSQTKEFDINRTEENFYHVISRQPDFHVEIKMLEDGLASAKCQCMVFRKNKFCRHAIGSLLLLRDYFQRGKKARKRSNQEVLDDVLKKLSVTELRSFLSSYAISHSTLRAEILSNYLHLTRKPDYHTLYNDLAPVDKYGQIKLNRNNIKTIRSLSATLLKRGQQLLKDGSLSETMTIIEAVMMHLHRLWAKAPQFQDQITVELKQAYKTFEWLCKQPMAPRLQQRAITLSLNVCERESYHVPAGYRPLLFTTEAFILEEKARREAFSIAEHKAGKSIQWLTLLTHWMRIWSFLPSTKTLKNQINHRLPALIREHFQNGSYEDVLFTFTMLDKEHTSHDDRKALLSLALRSAKNTGDKELMHSFAYELSLHFLDIDAWEILDQLDRKTSQRVLNSISDLNVPGSNTEADHFLLESWLKADDLSSMLSRLKEMNDIETVLKYDRFFTGKFEPALSEIYAVYIRQIRDQYGGVAARQKLNNIFSHLKQRQLTDAVAAEIKRMETESKDMPQSSGTIKGFVFDLDGVIVDTAIHHFKAWKKILSELGAEITIEDDHHTRGAGRMESLNYLLDRYNINLSEEEKLMWAGRKNDVYVEAINSITPDDLLPGAMKFLEDSKAHGLLLALGSASKNARAVLDKLGIADQFDAILDGNDAKASKPDPEIFEKACIALHIYPNEAVVFEDAAKGVQAALAAGCKVVGIGDKATLSAAHFTIPDLGHSTPAKVIEQLS